MCKTNLSNYGRLPPPLNQHLNFKKFQLYTPIPLVKLMQHKFLDSPEQNEKDHLNIWEQKSGIIFPKTKR